jgi:hypothetical protein
MDYDFCHHQLNQASKVDENGASLSPTNSTNATRSLQMMMLSSVLGGAIHRDNNAKKHTLDNDHNTNNTVTSSSSSMIQYNSPKRKVARLVGCFHNGESKRPLRMIGDEALLLRPANWNNGSALSVLTGGNGSSGSSSHSPLSHSSSHHHRAIVAAPTRILDAPDLMDDYYLNLLRSVDNQSTRTVYISIHPQIRGQKKHIESIYSYPMITLTSYHPYQFTCISHSSYLHIHSLIHSHTLIPSYTLTYTLSYTCIC